MSVTFPGLNRVAAQRATLASADQADRLLEAVRPFRGILIGLAIVLPFWIAVVLRLVFR